MKELVSQKKLVNIFNVCFPVGTPVDVRRDNGEVLRTVTLSRAWMLCGTGVVSVEGIAGGFDLDCIFPVQASCDVQP